MTNVNQKTTCPACKTEVSYFVDEQGQQTQCPECEHLFVIPMDPSVAELIKLNQHMELLRKEEGEKKVYHRVTIRRLNLLAATALIGLFAIAGPIYGAILMIPLLLLVAILNEITDKSLRKRHKW